MIQSRLACVAAFIVSLALGDVAMGEPGGSNRRRTEQDDRKQVAILIYEGVELLDFTGPAEVFIVANRGKSFRVFTVAETTEPLQTMGGMTVIPEFSVDKAPPADIVVVPGGNTQSVKAPLIEWIKRSGEHAEIVMSVCFGSFLLAKADLLDGIEATTHHWGLAKLKQAAPRCKVLSNRRYVDGGKIITTAGVTAGIDGALHIVERMLGKDAADWTAEEWMEYQRERLRSNEEPEESE